MSFSKYKELKLILSLEDLDQEIFILQKELFDLRFKRATNQSISPHLFKHAKCKLAQLKFKRSILLKPKA
mgnify:CR=1 FL=1